MDMPKPIAAFFATETGDDADALVASFADDATVDDEAASHVGHAAIRAWWTGAREKYQQTTDVLEAHGGADAVTVRCRVSGRFPGSPITLDFRFALADERITRLEIR
ncbi:nuclear transport factor 2 family protein [Segnochrobactrum spirostomi]|uniref:Nuclear transport factor 2 family protein n=1 Tax=Segnochrobactrum spirostomi TaxID=2608987 RepID=A0A6A7YAV7_9HYPH|nr:nuclear transport factor 2 family protein [Segnochrobactrum spirostomi]MQT14569.1 nuclear transport factor 2 family protein [Segnochrobactrum spirostomi]